MAAWPIESVMAISPRMDLLALPIGQATDRGGPAAGCHRRKQVMLDGSLNRIRSIPASRARRMKSAARTESVVTRVSGG